LEGVDLRLQEFDLGLGVVNRASRGDRGVGGGVGGVRHRVLGRDRLIGGDGRLRERGGAESEGAACEQGANDGGTIHVEYSPCPASSWEARDAPLRRAPSYSSSYLSDLKSSGASVRAAFWLRARTLFGAAIIPAVERRYPFGPNALSLVNSAA
jgi:hypothetical protein